MSESLRISSFVVSERRARVGAGGGGTNIPHLAPVERHFGLVVVERAKITLRRLRAHVCAGAETGQ